MKEFLTQQKRIADDLGITKVKETPGNIPGFTSFYDSGTYTPTYLGATTPGVTTYSIQQGRWARVGAVLTVTGTIAWTAATGTGIALFSLPLVSANVANQNATGAVNTSGVTFAAGPPQIIVLPNSTTFILQSPTTNAGQTNVNIEAAGQVVFTISYFVG